MSVSNSEITREGGCLCGAVRYQITGPLRDVVNCHCRMCQRLHGNFGPHTKARKENIELLQARGLEWYQTSTVARRGFCRECGSGLFWEPFELDATGILAGTLDDTKGLKTMGHIFTSEKCAFITIDDDMPQFEQSSDGALVNDYT